MSNLACNSHSTEEQAATHFTYHLLQHWYVAGYSKALGTTKPMASKICDVPLVLFRDGDNKVAALLDRCPHRNVPLSLGELNNGEVACPYHGWQFNRHGERTQIPGLSDEQGHSGSCTIVQYACLEQDGYIWVCPKAGFTPASPPMELPTVGTGYIQYQITLDLNGSLHAALENALDVAHTSFIHKGLFRGIDIRTAITANVQPLAQGIEAEYLGEPTLPGGRKPPKGVTPQHWDRFFMPATVQVEYKAGDSNHSINTVFHTPVDEFYTRFYLTSQLKMPRLGRLLKPFIVSLSKKVLQQDVAIIAKQTETIEAFGGEDFQSCRMDLFGPHITRLYRHAKALEDGEELPPVQPLKPRSIALTI